MGIESIFVNHIRTDEKSKNELLHPIVVKANKKSAKKRLFEFFNSNNYFNVDFEEQYGELYAERYPYEVTCYLIENEATTLINVLFYNMDGRKKKKDFIQLLSDIREHLADILDE